MYFFSNTQSFIISASAIEKYHKSALRHNVINFIGFLRGKILQSCILNQWKKHQNKKLNLNKSFEFYRHGVFRDWFCLIAFSLYAEDFQIKVLYRSYSNQENSKSNHMIIIKEVLVLIQYGRLSDLGLARFDEQLHHRKS